MAMLPSRAVEQFLAVCEARNLTEAAASCGVTQPAITKSIRKLEAAIGMPLFQHSTRGLVLTQAGRLLQRHAGGMRTQTRYLQADLAALADGRRGMIRMGMGHSIALTLLPNLVAALQAEFPNIDIEFETGVSDELYPLLTEGSIDLMIASIVGVVLSDDYIVEKILPAEMRAFARRRNPIWQSDFTAGDLVSCKWYLFSHDVEGQRALERYFNRHGEERAMTTLRCSALDTMMELAAQTDGLAYLASTLIQEAARRDLFPLPVEPAIWSFPIGLVVRKAASYVAPVQSIMRFCRQQAGG